MRKKISVSCPESEKGSGLGLIAIAMTAISKNRSLGYPRVQQGDPTIQSGGVHFLCLHRFRHGRGHPTLALTWQPDSHMLRMTEPRVLAFKGTAMVSGVQSSARIRSPEWSVTRSTMDWTFVSSSESLAPIFSSSQ